MDTIGFDVLTFSGVLLLLDLGTTLLEVSKQVLATSSDGSVVYASTTLLEQQQAVEVFEEDGVGLMDGTENGLTGGGKLSQESAGRDVDERRGSNR